MWGLILLGRIEHQLSLFESLYSVSPILKWFFVFTNY